MAGIKLYLLLVGVISVLSVTALLYTTSRATQATKSYQLSESHQVKTQASNLFKGLLLSRALPPLSNGTPYDVSENDALKWSSDRISQARSELAGVGCADVLMFAGGSAVASAAKQEKIAAKMKHAQETAQTRRQLYRMTKEAPLLSAVVDIFNITTREWSSTKLSEARRGLVAVATQRHVLFAGGEVADSKPSAVIDIYDVGNQVWTTEMLSQPRRDFGAAVVTTTAGHVQVLFGGGAAVSGGSGGGFSKVVDIWDEESNSWERSRLGRPRKKLTAIGVASKALFAGGIATGVDGRFSRDVDIYCANKRSWSRAQLSFPRQYIAAASSGDRAFFAGGFSQCFDPPREDGLVGPKLISRKRQVECNKLGLTSVVDVFQASTEEWSVLQLSEPRSNMVAASIPGGLAVFTGGNAKGTAELLYKLRGACLGPPGLPGGWMYQAIEMRRKWGPKMSATKEAIEAIKGEEQRANYMRDSCNAGPGAAADFTNLSQVQQQAISLQDHSDHPNLTRGGCKPQLFPEVNRCEGIRSNALELWLENRAIWLSLRMPVGRSLHAVAGARQYDGSYIIAIAGGLVRTRWRPSGDGITLDRVDILHVPPVGDN